MSESFVLIVYDISHDRRRTRLHDALLNYGTPVQYSVFECIVDRERLAQMKAAVARVVKPRQDRVRFYYLCQACLARTEITSGPEVLHETDAIVI
jgi:CRISPR-associated protein Cas2